MNKFILMIGFLFFVSCNNSVDTKEKKTNAFETKLIELSLVDGLGKVNFSIPVSFDTNFSWIYSSDCGKPCDVQKYRFQSKTVKIIKESGFLWTGAPRDSVESLTISHPSLLNFGRNNLDTAKNTAMYFQIKQQLTDDPLYPPINFDTIQKIGDRYFSIFIMEKTDSIQSKKVLAATSIRGNTIIFKFELLKKNKDTASGKFIENSLKHINTIRIS